MHSPGAQAASGNPGERQRARPFFVPALLAACALLTSCVYWTPSSHRPSTSATIVENVPNQHWDIKSCGAGALSSVLQHYGDPVSMKQWDAQLPKTRGGVMSIDLVLAARERGFDARLVTGDASLVEAELLDGRPVILEQDPRGRRVHGPRRGGGQEKSG